MSTLSVSDIPSPFIICVGANHLTSETRLREQLTLTDTAIKLHAPTLKKFFHLNELLILSTCNRFEIYAVSENEISQAEQLILTMQKLAGHELDQVFTDFPKNIFYQYKGIEAICHFYRVCASLNSIVIGETQITSQVKKAAFLAESAKISGPILKRLTESSFFLTKKIRTETKIGEKTVSLSHSAIDLAKRIFRRLDEQNFLFVGAGEMIELALRYATNYTPRNIFILNRSEERASHLAQKIGAGAAFPLTHLEEKLLLADIVISSTAAQNILIDKPMIERVLRKRNGKPIFLVDLAVPRDIDPSINELDEVFLFGLDELHKVTDENKEERVRQAEIAEKFVIHQAYQFRLWLLNYEIKPTIKTVSEYLTQLTNRELHRSLKRKPLGTLSEQSRLQLENLLTAITGRIVADIAQALYKEESTELKAQLVNSVYKIFNNQQKVLSHEQPNTPYSYLDTQQN